MWAYCGDLTVPERGKPGHDELFGVEWVPSEAEEFWKRWRELVMARWIAERPGTRPALWFRHECPPGAERLKVGGSGDEGGAIRRNGSRDYFDCQASDPPRVESEAAFLKRLGALQPAEEKRIPKSAWPPEVLEVDEEGYA